MISFGERLQRTFARFGHLCVGIDPHEEILKNWGLPCSAASARDFALRVLDLTSDYVGIYKIQIAFFERYGSEGIVALETVLSAARSTGAVIIADAKRGDIASTMSEYAKAWLCKDSKLFSHALTLSPYVGLGHFAETIEIAQQNGAGLFFLAATSEPYAFAIQSAILQKETLVKHHSTAAGAVNFVSNPSHVPSERLPPVSYDSFDSPQQLSTSLLDDSQTDPLANPSCNVPGNYFGGAALYHGVSVASYIFQSVAAICSSGISSFGVVLAATSDLKTLLGTPRNIPHLSTPPHHSPQNPTGFPNKKHSHPPEAHTTPSDPIVPILAPGFGHQGAELKNCRDKFGSLLKGVIVSESRSLLSASPDRLSRVVATRSRELQSIFTDSL